MPERLSAEKAVRLEYLESKIKVALMEMVRLPDDEYEAAFSHLVQQVPEIKGPLEKQRAFFKAVQCKG